MSEEKFLEWLSKLAQCTAIFKTKSAFTPLIWFCVPTIISCLWFASYFNHDVTLQRTLVFIVPSITGFVFICYLYFMLKNPNKLQSEEFQIRNQTLELIAKKGAKEFSVDSVDLVKISNPQYLELGKTEPTETEQKKTEEGEEK